MSTRNPRLDLTTVNQQLTHLEFADLYYAVTTAVQRFNYESTTSEREAKLILSSLEMFLLLCYKWIRSRNINSNEKIYLKIHQKELVLLRDDFIRLLTNMERETKPEIDYRPPQSTSQQLRNELAELGWPSVHEEHIIDDMEFPDIGFIPMQQLLDQVGRVENYSLPRIDNQHILSTLRELGWPEK